MTLEDKLFNRIAEICQIVLDALKQEPSVEVGEAIGEEDYNEMEK